jgi:hypothetical protein
MMRWLLVIFAIWFAICLVPDGRTVDHGRGDAYQETLYTSHTCESGRWYFENSDADSVTVNCYIPDPPPDPPADSGDPDQK